MNDITRGGRRGGDPGSGERARIAVVSTPRSGNTWLSSLLSTWCSLEQHAAHRPAEVSWETLPPRCILQLHWGRDEAFEASLRCHEFRVVTIARHPLGTLISLLNWVNSCPAPPSVWKENPCLAGRAGDERPLMGVSPRSPAFLDYATGPRAAALLSVTREWSTAHGALRVCYEELVAAPARELERLAGELGWAPRSPATDAIAVNTMDRLRILHSDRPQHFWQGLPGLWRELIPAAAARRIEAAHRDLFKGLGYACDPDEGLDDVRADLNWSRLQHQTAEELLRVERQKHEETRRRLAEVRRRSDDTAAELARARELRREMAELRDRLALARAGLDEARCRLEPVGDLGPRAVRVARGLHRLASRYPALSSAVRRLIKV